MSSGYWERGSRIVKPGRQPRAKEFPNQRPTVEKGSYEAHICHSWTSKYLPGDSINTKQSKSCEIDFLSQVVSKSYITFMSFIINNGLLEKK